MIFLIKFLLSSFLLFGFYHFVLRHEVTFRFNRFYLLCIVLLAAAIPFTVTSTQVLPAVSTVNLPPIQTTMVNDAAVNVQQTTPPPTAPNLLLWQVFLLIYIPVTLFSLFRFFKNLYRINRLYRNAKNLTHNGLRLMLRNDITETFSFMGTVYVNRQQFEAGQIPGAILEHERAHIQQKHSYDLLFIELITCLIWFNPILFLIRKAIKLNHEFLADQHVVKTLGSSTHYQNLLIHFASQQHLIKLPMVSHLTFGETKKRLLIMAKQSNRMSQFFKTTGAFILIAVLFIGLGNEKVVAQQVNDQDKEAPDSPNEQVVQDMPPPPPPVMVKLNPLAKVRFEDQSGKTVTASFKDLTDSQKGRFFDQEEKAEIMIPPPPKAKFTQAMLNDFQNAKKYRLWIDRESRNNAELANYSPDDFHHFFKTRVSKGKRDQVEFDYYLDIVTVKNMDLFLKERWIPMSHYFIPEPGEKDDDGTVVRRKNKN